MPSFKSDRVWGKRGATIVSRRSLNATSRGIRFPSRTTSTWMVAPGSSPATSRDSLLGVSTNAAVDLRDHITWFDPCYGSRVLLEDFIDQHPFAFLHPEFFGQARPSWVEVRRPAMPARLCPLAMSCFMTCLAMLEGIAKPMPWAKLMMAVLMPMTSPRKLNSGPPELPGLIEASV